MIEFRSLTQWPRPQTKSRKSGTFRANYRSTLNLLQNEIAKVGGKNVVIQAGFEPRDIRLDGLPRADARKPNHPGIVVSFDSRHGPLMFACDTYFDWQDNLRAVALTLENLRAVERYGATKHGEQYRGYAALPPAPSESFRSAEDAAEWLSRHSDPCTREGILQRPNVRQVAYRMAAAKLHPDSGGSHEEFVRLQAAKEMLEK